MNSGSRSDRVYTRIQITVDTGNDKASLVAYKIDYTNTRPCTSRPLTQHRIRNESQCGFKPRRSMVVLVLSLKKLQKKCRKRIEPLQILTIIGCLPHHHCPSSINRFMTTRMGHFVLLYIVPLSTY